MPGSDLTVDDADGPPSGVGRRRPRARRRRRSALLVGAALAGLAAILVGVSVASALSAKASLEAARSGLVSLRESEDADVESVVPALSRARSHVADAQRALDRLPVSFVAGVPVLGRSLNAERAVARVSAEVLSAAEVAAGGAGTLTTDGGGVDTAALDRLAAELDPPVRRSRDALDALGDTSVGFTPGAVRDAVGQAERTLGPVVAQLEDAVLGARLATGLLGGDGRRNVLVALANNAELRGSGGYVSSVAMGRAEGGRLSIQGVRDVLAVADGPGTAERVPAPPEFAADFGPLAADTTQFRSWNMSPHFPDSALVASRVAGDLLSAAPDLVVLLDVPAMTSLARLSGQPLVLGDGQVVSPDELQDALLVDSYAQAGQDPQEQVRRRAELQAAAAGVVSRLQTSDVAPVEALRTLADLAQGRHVALWSARPQEQHALERLGLAGAVVATDGTDLLHVSVNNLGANKLDLYLDRVVEQTVVVGASTADVVQRVTLTNRAPDGLVPYVQGTENPGRSVSRLELSLAPESVPVSLTRDGQPLPDGLRPGAQRSRVATRVELERGASTVVELRYRFPVDAGRYSLRAMPQALARDAELDVRIRSADEAPLETPDGVRLPAVGLRDQGPFSRTRDLAVGPPPAPQGFGEDLKRFWREPVRTG